MKLCRFWMPGKGASIGLVEGDRIYDLTEIDSRQFASFTRLICDPDLPVGIPAPAQLQKMQSGIAWTDLDRSPAPEVPHLLAPVTRQEIWAAGVTYLRSREARREESASGGSCYDHVYHAERPELFFKGTARRVAGPNAPIRIRTDSNWNVPEPELALLIGPTGKIVGFTIGNDVSSRDIEGENPLYLPQAKVYRGSCALGPVMLLAQSVANPRSLAIRLVIRRNGAACFEGSTSIAQMKRSFDDLISYLYRDQDFPDGAILLTGTGIVPPNDFTLRQGDVVEITVPEIGTLRNHVE